MRADELGLQRVGPAKQRCDPELDGDVGRLERSELGRDDGLYGATRLDGEELQGYPDRGPSALQPLEGRAQLTRP